MSTISNSIAKGTIFVGDKLQNLIRTAKREITQEIESLDRSNLQRGEDALREDLVERYGFTVPELKTGEDAVTKETVEHPRDADETAWALDVPYEGSRAIFEHSPGVVMTDPPKAQLGDGSIQLVYEATDDAGKIVEAFEEDIEEIEQYLEKAEDQISSFQTWLERTLEEDISARLEVLKSQEDAFDELPFDGG